MPIFRGLIWFAGRKALPSQICDDSFSFRRSGLVVSCGGLLPLLQMLLLLGVLLFHLHRLLLMFLFHLLRFLFASLLLLQLLMALFLLLL